MMIWLFVMWVPGITGVYDIDMQYLSWPGRGSSTAVGFQSAEETQEEGVEQQ